MPMQKIVPYLWFEDAAEEAANFYVSIFKNSKIDNVSYYGDAGPREAGSVMTVEFQLEGQDFMALNGGAPPAAFWPSIALFVSCETQDEVDQLWDRLSEGGETLPCGWVKDKFGFTWNIVPQGLGDLLGHDDPDVAQRAMTAMLAMGKLDIDALRRAAAG